MTLLVLIGKANNAKTVQLVIIIILIGKEMLSLMATSDGVALRIVMLLAAPPAMFFLS